MTVARVLVVSAEPVGPRMAGPAIRARELARVLAAHHEVTLAAPAPSDPDLPGVAFVAAGFSDYDALHAAVAAADVVVAQQLPARLLTKLGGLRTRLVADLYNPTVFEVLEAGRDKRPAARRRQQRAVRFAAVAQLAAANQVICASDKQRDLWLGVMAAHGLVTLAAYEDDPSLRRVIDVVPFGLPAEPPRPADVPPIRAMFPQIARDDRIVLWGGGVWNWLDPETAIDAVGLLEARRTAGAPRTHLVVMGLGRPAIEPVDAMAAGERMLAHLRRSGLEGRVVHVNRGWVPYAERGAWLLEADCGISAHRDHLETRFAFRTRLLDCLWARLPVVASAGDALADLVASEGLGLVVPSGEAGALAAALEALLGDRTRHARTTAAIDALAPRFTWERAAAPLVAMCAAPAPGGGPHAPALRRAAVGLYPALVGETRERLGVRGAAARVGRNLRRAVTPGR